MALGDYKRPGIEELASTLGIKPKVLEADIKDLAWLWEITMEDMELINPLSALDIANTITKAYIRGRNCRMGSYQTLWKHLPTKSGVMYHLARYVSEENSKERFTMFPRLRDCGVTSTDEFLSIAGRMNAKRTRKQEENERREREEEKAKGQQKVQDFMERMRKQRGYDILEDIRRMVGDEGN